MYSAAAVRLRRCTATRRDGQPCRAWATWADPDRRCGRHARARRPTRPAACRCVAYAWPHRPGGGLCEWLNEVPAYRLTTPPGTHAWPRVAPAWKHLGRLLERRKRRERERRAAIDAAAPAPRRAIRSKRKPRREAAA